MPKVITAETLSKATELLKAGKPIADVCKECGIGTSKARELAKAAGVKPVGKPSSGSAAPTTSPSVSDIGPKLVTPPGPGAPLADLLKAHPTVPGGIAPPAPQPEEPTEPPMSPEDLIVVMQLAKGTAVGMAIAAYGVKMDDETRSRISGFTDQERIQLKTLAPYAARFSNVGNKYTAGAMALAFLGMVGFSTVVSVRYVKQMAPKKMPKPTKDAPPILRKTGGKPVASMPKPLSKPDTKPEGT